ncbi:putative gustatory receptor 58a [Drosophila tropicalis]|uniref:putative gustatory receptor 58a n=1 Tax=Drosophila tropicalis TaxID=46794 RepID=UPI0035AB991E
MSVGWFLKIFYNYGLVSGLLPARLAKQDQIWHFRSGIGYIIYTIFVNCLLLLLLPFTLPRFMYTNSYMSESSSLQWNFTLTSVTRILAMLVCGGLVWTKRKKLRQLGDDLLKQCQLCEQLQEESNHLVEYNQLQDKVRGLLLQQFCLMNLNIFAPAGLLLRFESDQVLEYLLMVFVHMVQFIYIMIAMLGLYIVFLLIYWQMQRVNLGLKDLLDALHFNRDIETSLETLRHLYHLHGQNVNLLHRVLQMTDISMACLLLKMFVTNVNLVYHGVQFANSTIDANWLTKILGESVILTHYWHAILLMNLVDSLTRQTSIEMAQIMRQFSAYESNNRDFEVQLDIFSDHVRCHPTAYKVCGLFAFNKSTSLTYFFTVLIEVLVLVQFDLKNKVDAHQK